MIHTATSGVLDGTDWGFVFAANLETATPAVEIGAGTRLRLSDDGRDVFVIGARALGAARLGRLHVATRERIPTSDRVGLEVSMASIPDVVFGQDARYAAAFNESPIVDGPSRLYDLVYGRSFKLPFSPFGGSFDAASRFLAFATKDALAPANGDVNNTIDIYVADLPRLYDVGSGLARRSLGDHFRSQHHRRHW